MKKTRLEELAEKAVVDCQHSPPRDACYRCVLEAIETAIREQSELSAAAAEGLIADGPLTPVREILREIINMNQPDTVNRVNAAARLALATQETCARIAENHGDHTSCGLDIARQIREGKL